MNEKHGGCRCLSDLLDDIETGAPWTLDDENWSDMPTFGGGTPPTSYEGRTPIWSWDETHVLAGRCADELMIISRQDWTRECPNG